eukprot:TRINITY_DN40562_c0_g1_i5.p2 TRINITY_DN40562_c0_g1~~TRINITY_DN40562_c0_g1_i5.p2  ORF type:complete len:176 (-),score=28.27 TRINITY_DN40562_c0_g1_i5:83-610(-)
MIDYEEDPFFCLVCRRKGSIIWRAAMFALPSACLSAVFVALNDIYPSMRDEYGLMDATKSQLWNAVTAVLFALIMFRCNKAYARFWEGTSLLHQMRGEWFNSVSNCVNFSTAAKALHLEKVEDFRHTIVRLMSLCHGSALEEISGIQRDSFVTIDTLGLRDFEGLGKNQRKPTKP